MLSERLTKAEACCKPHEQNLHEVGKFAEGKEIGEQSREVEMG